MPLSPSSLDGYEFNSQAEKAIYLAAAESKYFNNTERYLFHSLNMAKTGDKKMKSEIDFVYMDSDCILFLEVKGGLVKFDSLKNQWYVIGGTEPGDPFTQAYNSLFHTRDTLLPQLFHGKNVSNRLAFGIGVLFPESIKPNEFSHTTTDQMEFDPDLIYDYDDHKKNGLIEFIEKVKHYWRNHPQYAKRFGLSHKEVSIISSYFRKDLHFKLPVSDLLKKEDNVIHTLTAIQSFVLDNLDYNPRKGGIILGGPGTGKTLLAFELLKRLLQKNKKVLLICYNKNLAEYLNSQCKKFALTDNYLVVHLHGLYRSNTYVDDSKILIQDNDEFWSRDLPLHFKRYLKDSKKETFDYIILDEGQDVLNEYHFDAVGRLLKGGFDSGNWAIFMDKEYQNIYNNDADEYFEYMRTVYPCFVNLLQLNCRNTISIVREAAIQTGFPQMACLRTDEIWKSTLTFHSSSEDLKNKINDKVILLEKSGIERRDITILCFTKDQITDLLNSNPKKYAENAFDVPGKINVCTIHSYKGLENKFILICGPEQYDSHDKKQMSLIYIANTRATQQSTFFLNNRYRSIIVDRIMN